MKKTAILLLFVLLTVNAFTQTQSISQIRTKWNQLKPKTGITTYETTPSAVQPYNPGRISNDFLNNGLNTLNFARYLAGLPDVSVQAILRSQCQDGALVMAINGVLSHTPAQPPGTITQAGLYPSGYKACGSSNIFWSSANSATLDGAVRAWLSDSDPSNISRVGHRRWMLNPAFAKTGFGCATNPAGKGTFITMYVMNSTGTTRKDRVLWPNEGYFPSDFFEADKAWSISLNSAVYSNTTANTANISVKLTCLNNNRVWTFTKADTNTSGKYFKIDTVGYGMDFCIIFRPDGITSFGSSTNKFKVEVTGLKGVNNSAMPVMTYNVEFFTL